MYIENLSKSKFLPGETNVLCLVQERAQRPLAVFKSNITFLAYLYQSLWDLLYVNAATKISVFFKNERIVLISYYILFAFIMNLPSQKVVTKPLKAKKLYLISKQFYFVNIDCAVINPVK